MKKIVAINCSPRTAWNTATLVREAAKGAEGNGDDVTVIDLYKLMTVLSCPKCGILKQGVPEDLDEFAEEILDEM